MTTPFGTVRWNAVRAVSARQWRSSWRSRRMAGAIVFAGLAWVTGPAEGFEAQPGIAAFVICMFVAIVTAAAVVARDFESGAMVLERLHGASPFEIVGANLLYAVATTLAVYGIIIGVLLAGSTVPWDQAIWAVIGLGALGLVTTCSLLVMLGALLPGYGNVAVFLALMVVGGNLDEVARAALPSALVPIFEWLGTILPLPHVVTAGARQFMRGAMPIEQLVVLCVGAPASILAAVLWLETREPAKGWKR